MFCVYLLKSLKDKKYYIGQTINVHKRFNMHNSGKVISTKSRIPFILIGFKKFQSRGEARWFEYDVKHHSDKKNKFINMLEVQKKSEVS